VDRLAPATFGPVVLAVAERKSGAARDLCAASAAGLVLVHEPQGSEPLAIRHSTWWASMHKTYARTGAYELLTTLCASCILALRLANTALVSGPARTSEIAMSDESATLNSCRGFALTAGSPDSNNCRLHSRCERGSSRGPLGLRERGIAVCCPYTTMAAQD